MQWWNDFVDWLLSSDARPVIFNAVVLLVAIIVAGLLSAWIARGAIRGLITRTDRQQKASAIAALVDAATEASSWNSLTPHEQILSDRTVGQADILVRLLPLKGANIAADWAGHQLAEMKRNSATTGYQISPAVGEFRERLIDWQNKPSRARKIFENDLERWRFDTAPAATPAEPAAVEPDVSSAAPEAAAAEAAAPGTPNETVPLESHAVDAKPAESLDTASADTLQTEVVAPHTAA